MAKAIQMHGNSSWYKFVILYIVTRYFYPAALRTRLKCFACQEGAQTREQMPRKDLRLTDSSLRRCAADMSEAEATAEDSPAAQCARSGASDEASEA